MDIFYWIFVVLTIQAAIQLVINFILGISFTYINPFSLSIHGLTWKTKTQSGSTIAARIGSIRFHFSIFGLWAELRAKCGNQYCFWIIEDVHLDLSEYNKGKSNASSNTNNDDVQSQENEEHYDQFNVSQAVRIYPQNFILKFIVSWLLYLSPAVGLQITDANIICPGGYKISLSRLEAHTNINASFSRRTIVQTVKSHSSSSFHYWLTTFQLDNLILHDTKTNNVLSTFFDSATISSGFKINLLSGVVQEVKNYARVKGTDVSFLYLMKLFNTTKDTTTDRKYGERKTQLREKSLLSIFGVVFKLLDSASVSIQFFKISEIPLVNKDQLLQFTNLNDIQYKEVGFASFNVDNISFGVEKLDSRNVGYNLKYVDGSYPVNWRLSINSVTCLLDLSTISNYSGMIKQFEILSIPNIMINIDSTMLINLLRLIFNKDAQFQHRHTILEMQLTISRLTLDISAEQLGILLYIFGSIKSKKTSAGQKDLNLNLFSKLKQKYGGLISETTPKWSFKILLENPIFIIRSESETTDSGKDMHITYLSPSLVNAELEMNASSSSLEVFSRLDVPNLSVMYQRNNANKNADKFFVVKDINWKNSFTSMGLQKLDSWINVNFLDLNLTNLSTLVGLQNIITNTMKFIMSTKQLMDKERQIVLNIEKVEGGELIFKDLPDWFKQLKVELSDIKIKLGAKSILMSPEVLLDENGYDPAKDDLSKNIMPSFMELKLDRFEFSVINRNDEPVQDGSSSIGQSDKLKSLYDYYYMTTATFRKLIFITETMKPDSGVPIREKCIDVALLGSKIYVTKEDKLEIVNSCDILMSTFSVLSNFTVFSAVYLLKNTILKPFINKSSQSEKPSKKSVSKEKNGYFSKILWRFYLKEFQLKLKLSNDFYGRIDVFGIKVTAIENPILVQMKLFRIAVKKESTTRFYNRLLTFENMNTHIKLPDENQDLRILISNTNVKISVPSEFIVHTLFDAIKLTVKLNKRFIYILKTNDAELIPPIKESKSIKLPTMRLKSKELSFAVEDDPFEAELGMIFQLGLVEQRSRLSKLKEFQKYVDSVKNAHKDEFTVNEIDELITQMYRSPSNSITGNKFIEELSHKLYKLRINIAQSWKYTVEEFKMKKNRSIKENYEYLAGTLSLKLPASAKFNEKIVDFNADAPLMGLLFRDISMTVSEPHFHKDQGEVKEFLNRVGKGYPRDTKWNQVVPMKLQLSASEVRVHIRDYTLPMVYIPGSDGVDRKKNSSTFVLNGDIVIVEMMPQSERELWYKDVSVFSGTSVDSYSCKVATTICKTKMIYEADCAINSTSPTTATWSNAYQPALRHLDRVFDGFSKPTRDPSLKLGVWDKMRDIVHGHVKFRWTNPKGEVHIRVPNANDPYSVLSNSAGFALTFKDEVEWSINDPERENESDYFIFKANKITFGVPNYLATPLPSWNSDKLIFFPSHKGDFFVSSLYGYYLNTDLYFDPNNQRMVDILETTKKHSMKSFNIELAGNIEFKLSFTFERDGENGKRTTEFKPHWKNLMCNPEYVDIKEGFDSYEGFRSNYIHMALSLKTDKSQSNFLRLSPRAIRQFMSWFKKFSAAAPPIRHGPLWNFKANSVKLGRHLMTFKFLFLVEPLYIYHGYRIDMMNPQNKSVVGLKGRIGKFMCDLHQRKEKKIKHVEFLDKKYSILSMTFYLGSVELHDVDLRAIRLLCDEPEQGNMVPKFRFEIFDEDQSWINLLDFKEIDLPDLNGFNIQGKILPLLHAKHFKYSMKPKSGESDFGFEHSHECAIDMESFPESKFNHVFEIEHLRFKWYSDVRDIVFDYITEVGFRDAYIYSTSYGSRSLIKDRMARKNRNKDDKEREFTTKTGRKASEWATSDNPEKDLERMLHSLSEAYNNIVPVDNMIIRLVDIQVQLMTHMNAETIILLHTPRNDIQIIQLCDKNWLKNLKQKPWAKRFGTVFQSANLYVISKNDFSQNTEFFAEDACYGSNGTWPIFLNEHSSKHLSTRNQIFSDICIVFFFEKINTAFSGSKGNTLCLSIPSLKIKFTSLSYRAFFELTQKLLIYSSVENKKMTEASKAIMNSVDTEGALELFENLESNTDELKIVSILQECIDALKDIDEERAHLDSIIRDYAGKKMMDIFLMAKSLLLLTATTENDENVNLEWLITAGDLNVDFFDDDRKFLSFKIKEGRFSRLEHSDGSTNNEIKINSVNILNEDVDILFPELLSSYGQTYHGNSTKTVDDMINVKWELGPTVGGLHDVKLAEITCHPMRIALEDKTGVKLMKFLFPNLKDEDEHLSESDLDSDYVSSSESKSDSGSSDIGEKEENTEEENRAIISEPLGIDDDANSLSSSSMFLERSEESTGSESHAIKTLTKPTYLRSPSKNVRVSRKSFSSASSHRAISKRSSTLLNVDDAGIGGQLLQTHMEDMKTRAEQYFNIRKFQFNSFTLSITLHGTGKMRVMNVNELIISVPSYSVTHKMWGYVDLVNSMKKHVIKTLLKHTGKLLKNKLFVYKRKRRFNRLKPKDR